jgi:hypothetical protein
MHSCPIVLAYIGTVIAAFSWSQAAAATEGGTQFDVAAVRAVNARPPSHSWTPPLVAQLPTTRQAARASIGPRLAVPPKVPPAIRWTTEAALLALAATGSIQGYGRDDTGDIGKPLLGTRLANEAAVPTFRGSIR